MQHILNVAFDFDDERVRAIVAKKCEESMDDIIKDIILDKVAPYGHNYYSGKKERDWTHFYGLFDKHIDQFIVDHKDEVLEMAAVKLADSVRRTKAWKEKYSEVI